MQRTALKPIRVSFGRKTRAELQQPLGRAHWQKVDCSQKQQEYFLTPQFVIPLTHLERLDKEHVMKTKWWLTPSSRCAYLKACKFTFSGAGGCRGGWEERGGKDDTVCDTWEMLNEREKERVTERKEKRFAWSIFKMSRLSWTINTNLGPRHLATHVHLRISLENRKRKTRSNHTWAILSKHYHFSLW